MKDLAKQIKREVALKEIQPKKATVRTNRDGEEYQSYSLEQRRAIRDDYKIFLDKEREVFELEMQLQDKRDELREWTIPALAVKHGVPHTTVRYIVGTRK